MPRLGDEKGVVLLQVLTMAIILSTVAMMLIQWQYGRHVAAYRMETSQRARAIAEAALAQKISELIPLPSGVQTVPAGISTIRITGDPVFGDCNVYITNSCSYGNICAYFDPCSSDCTNPCL